jgi:hypothetical protein
MQNIWQNCGIVSAVAMSGLSAPRKRIINYMGSGIALRQTCTKEELMDTPTSAAPDEKTPPLATQLSKEKSKPSGPLEISASVARSTSNSIDELQGLVSELQKMQDFLKSEVDNVQRQIDSALAGINIIVETIGPWKSLAGSQTLPSAMSARGDRRPNIEQRMRVG